MRCGSNKRLPQPDAAACLSTPISLLPVSHPYYTASYVSGNTRMPQLAAQRILFLWPSLQVQPRHTRPPPCRSLLAAAAALLELHPSNRNAAAEARRFRCPHPRRVEGWLASHVTPHTSHLTPHTSHLTPHTSLVTPHTSHLTPHTSHLTPHTSHSSTLA